MKVRFHDGDVRLRLSDEELSLLNQGHGVHSLTPMIQGDPLDLSLFIAPSVPEITVQTSHRDVEFRFPLSSDLVALLSRESISYTVDLMTSKGLLHLSIERDLGRGMHRGDSE